MTRHEKRIADGWTLSHWVVKVNGSSYVERQYDSATHVTHFVQLQRCACRFGSIESASKALSMVSNGKILPVFTRTIKVKRGHSFSWALARMKEGKRVRMARWVSAAYVYVRENTPYFVNETKSDFRPDFCHIMANDWELAE